MVMVIVVVAWGGLVVHIRHKLQCVRYGGVRALSGTISIGTPHNGSDSDDEMDDTGDNHDEGVGMMMLSIKYLLHCNGV